jgi:uncharacterized protein
MKIKRIKVVLQFVFLFLTICLLANCAHRPSRKTFVLPQTVDKITLLLPLTGPYGNLGQSVRNGFLAAYYTDKKVDPNLPAISIIDVANGDIRSYYRQAISQGSTFIIGPLLNSNLAKLHDFSVPTLSLNWLPNNQIYNNLYQFGLSAIDEVTQIVARMNQQGYKNVLVIASKNAWGTRLAQTFTRQWQALNNHVVETLEFSTPRNLNSDIAKLLNIDRSYANARQLRGVLRENVRFLPRRRKDFDAIFLAASANMARQIVPLLRYYYVESIPIYATASVYAGKTKSARDQDLNGVIFCDMPWMLLEPDQLSDTFSLINQQAINLWPKGSLRYARFYALGIDSFLIFKNFNTLAISTRQTVQGATGVLFLTDDQHIRRLLAFAKIVDNQPVLLKTGETNLS